MGQFCLNGSVFVCPSLHPTKKGKERRREGKGREGKRKARPGQTNVVSRFTGCIWAAASISRSCQSKCLHGIVQILLEPEWLTRIVFHMMFWERETPYSLCFFLLFWYDSGPHSPSINHHPHLSLPSSSLLFPPHSKSPCSLQGWGVMRTQRHLPLLSLTPSSNCSEAHPQSPHAELWNTRVIWTCICG